MSEESLEIFLQTPEETHAKWPHKCERCGRFVKHDLIHHLRDGEGEYWATAHCDNCNKRVNAYPI